MGINKVVEVSLGKRSYSIHIGQMVLGMLGKYLPASWDQVALVSNPTVAGLYASQVTDSLDKVKVKNQLFLVPDGEEYKTLESAASLYDQFLEAGLTRMSGVVALGGGVIGDLTGFVAATYMRGLPFIQLPTTLLAQVDSSVGGKVAVNLPQGKNMVGCFYQPQLVLSDLETLKTLPKEELKNGVVEIIKCGFLIGEPFLSCLEKNMSQLLCLDKDVLTEVVSHCCEFKAQVVAEDERDFHRRHILNYGHTVGHAIEVLTSYSAYSHGQAVSVGMMMAARISEELGLANQTLVDRQEAILKLAGLPTQMPSLKSEEVLKQILTDKKRTGEESVFVLLKDAGKPLLKEVAGEVIVKVLQE